MVEVTLTTNKAYADPFRDVTLDMVFTTPQGNEVRVPAFWAGANLWKARYASPIVGEHTFRSACSHAEDESLHGVTGKLLVAEYRGKNPLYMHGPLRVAEGKRSLEYADGKPFFWLGDTWWMGLCHRLSWPDDFQKLTADRKAKGFNVIQLVAGLYPDMPPFDARGANEAGFPWGKDYARIRPEYFNAADERILYLVDQGFTPCIVGAWGYFMQWMGVERCKQHWRNLIARYGALPVVWVAAGEANLPWYLAKGFPYDDRKQVSQWTEVLRYMRVADPFHRLITIHPTGQGRWSARHCTDDPALLDFDMLQTPHGQREAVELTVNTIRQSYADAPRMPVINGEAAYEMLGDALPTQWTRRMFWLCMMNGAPGHTYGANGIWQVNRKGQPHGPSPHMGAGVGYGAIPWDEAMNLPGSAQVSLGRKLFEEYPWERFAPHPEWVTFTSGGSSLALDGVHWIWFPEGKPAQDAPAEVRFFRRAFFVPEDKTIQSAQLRISADDRFSAHLNGEMVGTSNADRDSWRAGKQFTDFKASMKPGPNILAIEAENMPAPTANPAGLLARLHVEFSDGSVLDVLSDADWRSAKNDGDGWKKIEFDDSSWNHPVLMGKHGEAPWGRIGGASNEGVYGPQATGILDVVRIIYIPEPDPVTVREMGRNVACLASYFNPVTGEKTPLGRIISDDAGSWTCPPLPDAKPDWVLVIESPEKAGAK